LRWVPLGSQLTGCFAAFRRVVLREPSNAAVRGQLADRFR
jgi:hypothetical protein